jgi:hypothetical protein
MVILPFDRLIELKPSLNERGVRLQKKKKNDKFDTLN